MFPSSKEKSPTHTRMNSTNLYVTTTQIILKADPTNPQSWQDLYRLIPYLRNSLCCVVCSMLLVDPLTPTNAQCQHHLCRRCKGGRKKIKPQCENCKECIDYKENKSLKILMQLYKKMCFNVINSKIFKCIKIQAIQPSPGFERGASNLILLLKEGAIFQDEYESRGGLPKSSYSILPCIYSNSSGTQNLTASQQNQTDTLKTQNRHRTSLYSVVYPGSGNKITIKRKPKESTNSSAKNVFISNNISSLQQCTEKVVFKKPCNKPKKGCRCGNATATPGKLTCCGQRCPCYVESKACINCKCRGCRNPHRPDGNKVMPFIPELKSPQIVVPPIQDIHVQQIQLIRPSVPSTLNDESMSGGVKLDAIQLDTHFNAESLNNPFKAYKLLDDGFDQIQTLTASDLLTYALPEDEEDTDITVV